MPPPRGKRTTLTVDRETFEEYFFVGSTGVNVARDALAADKIRTPYEAIALVCLVNELEAEWFFWDTVVELEQYGKDDDYFAAYSLGDRARCDRLMFDNISKDRVLQMLLDVQSDPAAKPKPLMLKTKVLLFGTEFVWRRMPMPGAVWVAVLFGAEEKRRAV